MADMKLRRRLRIMAICNLVMGALTALIGSDVASVYILLAVNFSLAGILWDD